MVELSAPARPTSDGGRARVAVFGLGYVGTVTAACLARDGHRVVGVDVSPAKVAAVEAGRSPVAEPGLADVVRDAVAGGRLRATADHAAAVRAADLSLVCVGTPSDERGGLDLGHVGDVAQQIGAALRTAVAAGGYHVVVLRSTMLPGSALQVVLPVLEAASGGRAGRDFGLCVNPEFLREGTGLADYDSPPFTVVGELDRRSGDALAPLYAGLAAPLVRTDLRTAEMVKYACNAWHALKIAFANEVGNFCKQSGIDGQRVMDIFALDAKLNLSAAYLRPGFAFGGSCLPKDLRALLHRSRSEHLELPVLESILRSNELQARRGVAMVLRTGKRRVGVLGFSFKEQTDDLRESPMVAVVEALLGKGCDVRVHDADVALGAVVGANRRYLEQTVPHIASLLSDDLAAVVEHAEVLVIGKRSPGYAALLAGLDGRKIVVDLVRILASPADLARLDGAYRGICW